MNYLAWFLQEGGGSSAIIVSVIILLLGIVGIIAVWTIFEKAGKPGWAAIVPIYSTIVFLDIVGRPAWWIILLFIPFVPIIVLNDLSKSFGKGMGFTIGLILLSPIFILILAFGDAEYVGPGGQPAAAAM